MNEILCQRSDEDSDHRLFTRDDYRSPDSKLFQN